jgi:hypothetical protein
MMILLPKSGKWEFPIADCGTLGPAKSNAKLGIEQVFSLKSKI